MNNSIHFMYNNETIDMRELDCWLRASNRMVMFGKNRWKKNDAQYYPQRFKGFVDYKINRERLGEFLEFKNRIKRLSKIRK